MSLIKHFIEKRETISAKTWASLLGLSGNKSNAGISVNATTAMRQSAVFACVLLLSSTFAYVPWITYKRLPRGKDRAFEHRLYSILHDRPNPEQNSFTFRSTAMAHALLYGNGLAEIEFDNQGLPAALWPIPAWRVKPLRTGTQELYYQVTLPDGGMKNLPPYRIWHLMGLSTDGIWGMSVIGQARESIGLALATEEFGARFFSGGANVGGVAQHPLKLSEQGHKNLQQSLDEEYAGLGRSHRLLLLEEGMTYQKVGIPNNDSQFLETRTYQVIDIARMFRVPPHMIAELTNATFTNIEHQGIEFVVYTMNPWFVNAEQETNYKLFKSDSGYFSEFLVDGLLRGDAAARATFYNQMFMIGAFSPNDIREKENLNPIDGGDEYYIPLNMQPTSWGSQPSTGAASLKLLEDRKRSKGSAIIRYRIAKSFRPVFENAGQRIVDRETQNIRRAVKKHLSERSLNGFMAWLDDFYRDFTKYIHKQIAPAASALNDAIRPAIADQIGQITDTDKQIGEYVNAFGVRYTTSSSGQMKALLKEAEAEDIVDLHQAAESIEGRLTEWEEKRPSKIGMNETVQLANFITKTLFAGAGITKLIWTNTGAKPCPYCEEMDGRVVGIEKDFLGNDDKLNAEGEDKPMTIYRPTSQPPLHEGCECQIEPG
jgi:HK97 family phage portal protein